MISVGMFQSQGFPLPLFPRAALCSGLGSGPDLIHFGLFTGSPLCLGFWLSVSVVRKKLRLRSTDEDLEAHYVY